MSVWIGFANDAGFLSLYYFRVKCFNGYFSIRQLQCQIVFHDGTFFLRPGCNLQSSLLATYYLEDVTHRESDGIPVAIALEQAIETGSRIQWIVASLRMGGFLCLSDELREVLGAGKQILQMFKTYYSQAANLQSRSFSWRDFGQASGLPGASSRSSGSRSIVNIWIGTEDSER